MWPSPTEEVHNCFSHFSWYWMRPSYVIVWQHEKESAWCVFYTQPSLDRRRKNSQQRLGSCWSLSTLAVSLSVIIFHACHFDQIYNACVLFIRVSIGGEGRMWMRLHTCRCTLTYCTCINNDSIPPGCCGKVGKGNHTHLCPDLIWVWMKMALINWNFQHSE